MKRGILLLICSIAMASGYTQKAPRYDLLASHPKGRVKNITEYYYEGILLVDDADIELGVFDIEYAKGPFVGGRITAFDGFGYLLAEVLIDSSRVEIQKIMYDKRPEAKLESETEYVGTSESDIMTAKVVLSGKRTKQNENSSIYVYQDSEGKLFSEVRYFYNDGKVVKSILSKYLLNNEPTVHEALFSYDEDGNVDARFLMNSDGVILSCDSYDYEQFDTYGNWIRAIHDRAFNDNCVFDEQAEKLTLLIIEREIEYY